MANSINIVISILAFVTTIFLAINGNKVINHFKKKKLKNKVHSGYNSVLYFNLFWVLPIIFLLINLCFLVFLKSELMAITPSSFIIFSYTFFYFIICWIINLNVKDKFDYNIKFIKSLDRENYYDKYYKSFKVKSKFVKNFSIIFAMSFAIADFFIFYKKYEMAGVILGVSFLIYVILLLIYLLIFNIDTDKVVIKANIAITIDYRPLQDYFLRIKVNDDKMFDIDDDSIKIYSLEGATLYTISKNILYDITTNYRLELRNSKRQH